MRLLLDENIPRSLFEHLIAQGHDVVSVAVRMSGATDREVLQFATQEERVLVTVDQDFANILTFPQFTHAGILFLRSRVINPVVIKQLLDGALATVAPNRIYGRLVVVSSRHIRIYPRT